MSALSDRLIATHDPEAQRAAHEAYLADRAARMPSLTAHQEAMSRGESATDIFRRDAARRGGRADGHSAPAAR